MVAPTKVWRENNADRNGTDNTFKLNQVVSDLADRYGGVMLDGMRMLPATCGTRRCGAHDSVDALGYVRTHARAMPGPCQGRTF